VITNALVCWKCGAALADQPLPLSRLARKCREQDAEEVTDKERANFCGYFKARSGAYRPGGEAKTQAARAKLGDLFGADDKLDREPES
jgi:hypothetical protein